MARGWKPCKLRLTTDQWIANLVTTVFLNRPPGIYKLGAQQRVTESTIDWYWLGRFTSDAKLIDFLEAEIKREEI